MMSTELGMLYMHLTYIYTFLFYNYNYNNYYTSSQCASAHNRL